MYIVIIRHPDGNEKCFPAESVLVLGERKEGQKKIIEQVKLGPSVERLASKALRDCEKGENE